MTDGQPWFKHWSRDSLTSLDLLSLSDHEERVWWRLLALASIQEPRWTFPIDGQALAHPCASTPQKVIAAIKRLAVLGMVDIANGRGEVRNWRQFQEVQLTTAERSQRYRERRRGDGNVTLASRENNESATAPPLKNHVQSQSQRSESETESDPVPVGTGRRADPPLVTGDVMGTLLVAMPHCGRDETLYSECEQLAEDYPDVTAQTRAIAEARRTLRDDGSTRRKLYPSDVREALAAGQPSAAATWGFDWAATR